MIGHGERVKLAALQRLGEAGDVAEVEVGVGVGDWVAPSGGGYSLGA